MASQNSSILISNIYNSRKVILELMKQQGYNVNDYSNFSINEVNSMKLNNQLDMLLETNDDNVTDETIENYLSESANLDYLINE